MKDLSQQPHIKIGDTVWWVHCSNQCYKGTVEKYSFCEGQGAVYLHIFSPSFRRNPHPVVHYSFCFLTREQAKEFVRYLNLGNTFCKRCDRCKFNATISENMDKPKEQEGTDKDLNELKDFIANGLNDLQKRFPILIDQSIQTGLLSLITAEQRKRAVRSEDVQRAIKWVETTRNDIKGMMGTDDIMQSKRELIQFTYHLDVIKSALEQMNTWSCTYCGKSVHQQEYIDYHIRNCAKHPVAEYRHRIAELEQMQEKEPCTWCKTGKIIIHVPGFRAIAIANEHRNREQFDLECEFPICPYCGKSLKGDSNV